MSIFKPGPELLDDPEEIAKYNARAYDSIATGMLLVRDSDKWVPPKVKGFKFREKNGKR